MRVIKKMSSLSKEEREHSSWEECLDVVGYEPFGAYVFGNNIEVDGVWYSVRDISPSMPLERIWWEAPRFRFKNLGASRTGMTSYGLMVVTWSSILKDGRESTFRKILTLRAENLHEVSFRSPRYWIEETMTGYKYQLKLNWSRLAEDLLWGILGESFKNRESLSLLERRQEEIETETRRLNTFQKGLSRREAQIEETWDSLLDESLVSKEIWNKVKDLREEKRNLMQGIEQFRKEIAQEEELLNDRIQELRETALFWGGLTSSGSTSPVEPETIVRSPSKDPNNRFSLLDLEEKGEVKVSIPVRVGNLEIFDEDEETPSHQARHLPTVDEIREENLRAKEETRKERREELASQPALKIELDL